MFKVPEKYRMTKHHTLNSDPSFGNNGAFKIPFEDNCTAFVIASDGEGWEHVSVHIHLNSTNEKVTPEWEEMCHIKDLFWSDEDCVIQYHPPKSEYVNNHEHCLHLWRPIGVELPLPKSIMVGIKELRN